MPSSWVTVATSALMKIGQGPISGFNNLNKAEKFTGARYKAARDIVLRLHPWNCVVTRVTTAPLADITPAFGYEYYHQLPVDCLRVLGVGPAGVDYRVEGRKIATDETLLELRYVKREEDPTIIEDLCAECIALYLAWDLCEAFQQTEEKKKSLWAEFRAILAQAKSVDGKEEPAGEIEADLWIDSRLTGPETA